ncbi:hypothetical protein KAV67_03485 [Candidatus Bipolaricaulota bacterium]|nr:hypothetical protein [Candidatus Bipolaricaulota bacterium]
MSDYKHSLAFSVRAKDTLSVDLAIAPEIDSDGGFHPATSETILYTYSPTAVSFDQKKIIRIPEHVSERQRAKLERKKERQKWENVGALKKSTVAVTPFRVVWICKQRGDVSIGFSPKGLMKAALKTAASAVMAAGKWYIGQVLLSMITAVAARLDDRVVLLFEDSEMEYRVSIDPVDHKAKECAREIYRRSLSLVRSALEEHAPDQTDEIASLRELEASPEVSWQREQYTGYTVPIFFRIPVLPSR